MMLAIHRHLANHGGRTGSSLVLVVLLISLLSFAGVSLKSYSSHIHQRVSAELVGELSMVLARSALEEAHAFASAQANRPGTALHGLLRSPRISAEGAPFAVEIPRTRALLSLPVYRGHGFTVSIESRILDRVPMNGEYEANGRVLHRVEIGGPGVPRASIERRYEYRVTLASAPRPFDRVTLFVKDGKRFFEPSGDAPGGVADTLELLGNAWGDAHTKLQELASHLESRSAREAPAADATNSRSRGPAAIDSAEVASRLKSLPTQPANLAFLVASQFRDLEKQGQLISVFRAMGANGERNPGVVDLAFLNWWTAVRPEAGAVGRLYQRVITATSSLKNGGRSDPAGMEALLTDAQKLSHAVLAAVQKLWRIRNQLFLLPEDGAMKKDLEGADDLLAPARWIARAHVSFEPQRDGADVSLPDFLARHGHPASPFNGILHWRNKTPLVIRNLNLKGKLVIVADGDVDIEEANLEAGPGDLLTIVSLGRLRVSGRVRASIVALESLEMNPSAQVWGNLVTGSMPAAAGSVTYDTQLAAGATPVDRAAESAASLGHYQASLSPGPVATLVHR